MKSRFFLLSLTLLAFGSLVQAAQQIPPDRTYVESWYTSGYQGEIPAPDKIVNVRDYGAFGDGTHDDRAAIVAAIAALGGPGVVYFPAGTYLLSTSGFSIGNGVVLRGERSGNTTIRTSSSFVSAAVTVSGNAVAGTSQSVVSGYTAHSYTLQITSTNGLKRGDYVAITENNDPSWGTSFTGDAGQVLQIDSLGASSITVTNPIRMDFKASLSPLLQKLNMVTNAGIENIRFVRDVAGTATTRNNQFTIFFNYAANCWFRGVDCTNSFGADVGIQYSTRLSGSGCYFHHPYEVDGGGSGYGIKFHFGYGGECRFENNIFRRERHAMALQAGANGNVFGYNYSREPIWSEAFGTGLLAFDVAFHGNWTFANLCEGNIVKYIQLENDSGNHGVNGPHNTFVRNRIENDGLSVQSSDGICTNENVLANEIPSGSLTLRGSGNYSYGNIVGSTVTPAGTTNVTDYSYYLTNDPSAMPPLPVYWNIPSPYPSIGYPLAISAIKTNPAYARYASGTQDLTVGPPSLFKQPTNFTSNAGSPAAFSVQATGTPVAVFAWYKDGSPIAGQTNATCSIASAQPLDAGSYYCLITDGRPYSVKSSTVSLTVIGGVTCSYGLTSSGTNVSVNGGSSSGFGVTATDTSCTWTVSTDQPWITGLAPTSSNGNATVTYFVGANASGLVRTGRVVAASLTNTVIQDACGFSLTGGSSTNISVDGTGFATFPVSSTGTACTWTASADVPWITNVSPASATGSVAVTYSVNLNLTGSARTGHITAGGQVLTITQDACSFSLPGGSSTTISPAGISLLTLALDSTGTACTWTASTDVPWITGLTPTSGTGDATISYAVQTSPYSTTRTGHITAGGVTLSVNQQGAVSTFNDGVPDWWRQFYFGNSGTNSFSCATCDASGTQQNNLFKYVAGLDPTNPASVFHLVISPVPGQPTQRNLTFDPLADGRTYTAIFNTNLTGNTWFTVSPIGGPVTNGNQSTVTDLNSTGTNKFYRIDISYP